MIIRLMKNVRCQRKVSLIATTAVPNIQPRSVDVLSQYLQARKHTVSYCCRTLTKLVMLTTDFTITSTTCSFTDSHLGSLQIWTARTVLVEGIHKRMVRYQLNKPYKPHHSFVYALYFWNTLLCVRYKTWRLIRLLSLSLLFCPYCVDLSLSRREEIWNIKTTILMLLFMQECYSTAIELNCAVKVTRWSLFNRNSGLLWYQF